MPTLKGGSTIGIPSQPAIWNPSANLGQRIVLPTVDEADELQGFPRGMDVTRAMTFRAARAPAGSSPAMP